MPPHSTLEDNLMKLNKEFIRAWRAWNRISEVPISGRDYRNVPSLNGIIDELKHLNTYTYSLGLSVISGDTSKAAETAAEDILTLDRLAGEIEKYNISEETRMGLEAYIKATHSLLNEIAKLPQV